MQYALTCQVTSRQIALTLPRTSAKLSCHEGMWEKLREELPHCTHRHPPESAFQLIPSEVKVRFAEPEEACRVMHHAPLLPDQLKVLAFDGEAMRCYVYATAHQELPWVVVAYVGPADLLELVGALASMAVRAAFKGVPVDCSPKDL